jgi:hypothetical protein
VPFALSDRSNINFHLLFTGEAASTITPIPNAKLDICANGGERNGAFSQSFHGDFKSENPVKAFCTRPVASGQLQCDPIIERLVIRDPSLATADKFSGGLNIIRAKPLTIRAAAGESSNYFPIPMCMGRRASEWKFPSTRVVQ